MENFMKSSKVNLQEIEYLQTESMETFAKFYSLSFPELKLNLPNLVDFLKRKFPVVEHSKNHNIAALVADDGLIASAYGIVRNNYSQLNKNLIVGLVCDVFTHADFRKQGLFKRVSTLAIAREKLTKTSFLIGFPIRDEVMPGHLSVGWTHPFNMPLWWAMPRLGWIKDVQKNPHLCSSMFVHQKRGTAIYVSDEFLKWRFSFHSVEYFLVSLPSSANFAIVRKAMIRKLPFTCIIFMQATSKENVKILVKMTRNLALQLRTFGVLGCWNDSYANDLFITTSGLRKSSKFQKVIMRELNGFEFSKDESDYCLSWMDSDTL